MTGSTSDIIPIVIVPVLALVFWLAVMFRVASRPRWGSQAPPDTGSRPALPRGVPAQRLNSPGPAVPGQRPGTAAEEAPRERPRVSGIRK